MAYSNIIQLTKNLRKAVKLWAGIEDNKISWIHDIHYTLDTIMRWGMLDF